MFKTIRDVFLKSARSILCFVLLAFCGMHGMQQQASCQMTRCVQQITGKPEKIHEFIQEQIAKLERAFSAHRCNFEPFRAAMLDFVPELLDFAIDLQPFIDALFFNLEDRFVQLLKHWGKQEETRKHVGYLLRDCLWGKISASQAAKKLRFELVAAAYGFYVAHNQTEQTWAQITPHEGQNIPMIWLAATDAVLPEDKVQARKTLADTYKIHLMPQDLYFNVVIQRLMRALADERDQRNDMCRLVGTVKYIALDEWELACGGAGLTTLPKLVIYCFEGKEATEKLLLWVYDLFKDIPGCGIVPSFNEKITDCIFVAQGNRDDKVDPEKRNFFERPDRVYFVSDFTGQQVHYHLRKPWEMEREELQAGIQKPPKLTMDPESLLSMTEPHRTLSAEKKISSCSFFKIVGSVLSAVFGWYL
jgi:hypothetical protein